MPVFAAQFPEIEPRFDRIARDWPNRATNPSVKRARRSGGCFHFDYGRAPQCAIDNDVFRHPCGRERYPGFVDARPECAQPARAWTEWARRRVLKIRFSRKYILNFSGSNAEQFPEKDIFRVDGMVVRVYDP